MWKGQRQGRGELRSGEGGGKGGDRLEHRERPGMDLACGGRGKGEQQGRGELWRGRWKGGDRLEHREAWKLSLKEDMRRVTIRELTSVKNGRD